MSALPQSSPNAQGQAGPGEFGPACGEQTHALARTAAAKPGPAWPWALGELWGSALTVHCLLWGSFGVVGKLLGEPDFFWIAFSRPTAPSFVQDFVQNRPMADIGGGGGV